MIEIKSVFDEAFAAYGHVVEGQDWTQMLDKLCEVTPKPTDNVIYEPGNDELESLPATDFLSQNVYGGMPIEIGYCNGHNRSLNCLEYHRGAEVNIAADDVILLLAQKAKIKDYKLDTKEVEAFFLPAGTAALIYETALHYAPCTANGNDGFRVIIVLPKGTNHAKPQIAPKNNEDKLLWAANKWLLAHPESSEAASGAWVGLIGENIQL